MATKVKGEAIKEGSIPMSALSTEVKNKIENAGSGSGGANWNAEEGEAGYIENKPFGIVDFNSVEWFYDDDASWCITPMISSKVKYEGVIYEIPDNDNDLVNLGDGSIALAKYPYYDDNLMYVVCYGITESTDERLQNILFEVNTKLDEQYLPDTILKTTPQTLSDDDKNQALANLGIKEKLDKLVNVTYSELKSLRDNSQLIPGQQYRITDYVTTTIQENTQSAGHQFDIIVTADDESTLNNIARSCLHDGDTYFSDAGANLDVWQIWYSLDNDTQRFAWADTENGKGVIYRMIDEWNNDIAYDFKNIIYIKKKSFRYNQWGNNYQFFRDPTIDKIIDGTQYYGYSSKTTPNAWSDGKCWITDIEITSDTQLYTENGSTISYGGSINDIVTTENEYYTFRKDNEDDSLYGITKDNVVKAILQNGIQLLNNNIFGVGCYSNKLGNDSFNNTFGDNCSYNTLLGGFIKKYGRIQYCENNSFGNGCSLNMFGYVLFNNTFGENCYFNSFGNGCHDNSFGNDCHSNSFGNDCYSNSFGNYCYSNSLGSGCYSLELNGSTSDKTASVNSSGEAKVFNLADLADLLNL